MQTKLCMEELSKFLLSGDTMNELVSRTLLPVQANDEIVQMSARQDGCKRLDCTGVGELFY